MKGFKISPALVCSVLFLFFVASCRNETQVTTKPTGDKNVSALDTNRNARRMGNGVSRTQWEDNLTWA